MDSNNGNNTQKIIAAFVVMLAVVMATVGVNAYEKKQQAADSTTTNLPVAANTSATPESSATTQNTTPPTTSSATSSDIKDGTYTATSEYYVPHGYEDISVTLTIKDDVVTTSQITNSEDNPESARYQQRFTNSYKSYVVGKKASGLKLPYVAGASDTTDGFNDALEKILAQAQA